MPSLPDPPAIAVIGIGSDGWHGLDPTRRETLMQSQVVLGSARQLGLLPPLVVATRVPWPSPLLPALTELLDAQGSATIAVLASGDPLLSGIGGTLVRLLGADRVRVLPHLSSVTLAAARMGWTAESYAVVSTVARPAELVLRELHRGARIVVLSAGSGTPGDIARLLAENGCGESRMTLFGDLGGPSESRRESAAADWPAADPPHLHLLCIDQVPCGASTAPGLPDDAFENDGQLTKRDLRAAALSRLAPRPGELLWDVGAGAGSVGIEWARHDPRCRALAVESDPERAERLRRNASRLGVPGVEVVQARAPEALAGLPAPDAVFVGGGVGDPLVLDTCWAALGPGGRLVAHAVTLEAEQVLVGAHRKWGGELTRISVERAGPLGRFTGWTPARPITQFTATVPR